MVGRSRLRWSGGIVLAVAVSVALIGTSAGSGAATRQPSLPSGFNDVSVWTGLTLPTAIAFSPDGRVFVALKSGYIDVFSSLSATTPTVWADFHKQTFDNYDRGMLGLAVDPKLGTTGHDFVYALFTYDAPPGQTAPIWHDKCKADPGIEVDGCAVTGKLVRIPVNADGTAGRAKTLIANQWCQQFTSHSIGHLAFGPDGDLYVSGGEGASYTKADWGQLGGTQPATPTPANVCGDPPGGVGTALTIPTAEGGSLRAQSPRRASGEPVLLNGSVLRVNPKSGAGVVGNPMYNAADPSGNASRVVAYGFRNPFRFTFRPGTSEVWVSEVGAGTWEEIDRITGATVKPTANYGWPCYEGTDVHQPFDQMNQCKALYNDTVAPARTPFDEYNHQSTLGAGDTCGTAGGSSAISGISFTAANSNYPAAYQGALFFADHSRSCIWVEFPGAGGLPSRSTLQTFVDDSANPLPVDLETDPVSGDLFYVNIGVGGTTGSIHRITYTGP
jgi:glucose/arabinose dehydrogenase